MARADLKMLSYKELERFVRRVEKLHGQGLSMAQVSESLGVPKSTIYLRLKTYRSKTDGSLVRAHRKRNGDWLDHACDGYDGGRVRPSEDDERGQAQRL